MVSSLERLIDSTIIEIIFDFCPRKLASSRLFYWTKVMKFVKVTKILSDKVS